MINMEKRTSAAYDEKYCFLRYYDQIIAAKSGVSLEDKERLIQSVLTDAMLNESISAAQFVSLVVSAYAD